MIVRNSVIWDREHSNQFQYTKKCLEMLWEYKHSSVQCPKTKRSLDSNRMLSTHVGAVRASEKFATSNKTVSGTFDQIWERKERDERPPLFSTLLYNRPEHKRGIISQITDHKRTLSPSEPETLQRQEESWLFFLSLFYSASFSFP